MRLPDMTGGCQLRMSQRNPIALGPRAARNLLLASVLAVAGTSARSSTAADTSSERRVDRLAFGSCNKQWKPQPAWARIAALQPDVFIWGGDAVYAPQWSLDSLASSLAMQKENPAYKAFVEGRPVPEEDPLVPSSTSSPHPAPTVVGTWDDHDFGINDGGGSGSLTKYGVTDAAQRAQLFQDFLATPATSPARKRHGVYSSHQYGQGEKEVKVILLDTRSHRALHAIPSIGSVSKYAPVVGGLFGLLGALSRGLAAWAGLANQAQDTMLDAEQWKWLEDQLANSSARAHIIVSSIQVLTANPVVESWAHFPAERNRLLHLLNKHSPKGLLLLSGDVHMAELMSGTASDEVVEVTSSGLTHTCSSGLVPGAVCDAVVAAFSGSRYRAGPAYHPGRNFATVDFDWSSTDGCAGPTRSEEGGASDAPGISVTIHDVDTGRAVLSYSRPACAGPVTVAAPGVLWTGWRAAGVRACIAALCMALLVAAFKGARRRQRLPRARVGRGTADSKGR